jgi:hypothetical protein
MRGMKKVFVNPNENIYNMGTIGELQFADGGIAV